MYARSGNAVKAYAWCTRAASRALELHALDVATDFLQLALGHASSDDERFAVHHDLAVAAELSGRWADVERSCDAILAMPGVVETPARALPVQQRRAQARLRMGQGVREMERECRDLLAVAEQLLAPADIVRTRSLLVQTLQRLGRLDEAIALAEGSLRMAEELGDEALSAEAMHRLAHTVLGVRPRDAIELMLKLITLSRQRGDSLMEARAFLALGVARMRTRDDLAGAEAFRAALRIALEAHALDIAAGASMNLGVIEMRRGDFTAAHLAFHDALRLYTTLRNNTNRLAALYNLANLESERGDMDAAAPLYRDTAALAEQLGTDDIAIGAHAGLGLVALRQHEPAGARTALAAATRLLGGRDGWWFQGRERLESLAIRVAIQDGSRAVALARFLAAVERLEALDVYSAAWFVGECGGEVAEDEAEAWAIISRFGEHSMVQEFVPLAARYTALRDMANRQRTDRLRQGSAAEDNGGAGAAGE
jgi:tetratricopeptide (TPR) repeat protein